MIEYFTFSTITYGFWTVFRVYCVSCIHSERLCISIYFLIGITDLEIPLHNVFWITSKAFIPNEQIWNFSFNKRHSFLRIYGHHINADSDLIAGTDEGSNLFGIWLPVRALIYPLSECERRDSFWLRKRTKWSMNMRMRPIVSHDWKWLGLWRYELWGPHRECYCYNSPISVPKH